MNKLLEKLWQEDIEIITLEKLEDFSKQFYFNYKNILNYLIKKEQIIKIFGNIYYVKSAQEIKSKDLTIKYNPLELISKGLEFKNSNKWYFGLHSALRQHGLSLFKNTNDYLLSENSPFKKRKITILGKKITSFVFKSKLFEFGIIKNGIRYSDLEKTFLDFIYLWKYKNMPNHKIFPILHKYRSKLSKDIINGYVNHYPSNVIQVIDEFYKNIK